MKFAIEIHKRSKVLESITQAVIAVCNSPETQPLTESVDGFRDAIKKTLVTVKHIDSELAHTLAKCLILINELDRTANKYKSVVKIYLKDILDVTAQRTHQQLSNGEEFDILQTIRQISNELKGNPELKMKVQDLLDKIVNRVEKRYDREGSVDAMSLTSQIMASNSDAELRKKLIDLVSQPSQ